MKNKIVNRALSLLLALVCILGVLPLSAFAAKAIACRLEQAGVKGIWNFTNMELSVDNPSVRVENVHFADSLLTLSYLISGGEASI